MNLVQMYVIFLVYLVTTYQWSLEVPGGSLLSDTNLNRGTLWENLEKG